jgi:FkbM family methyltransferase
MLKIIQYTFSKTGALFNRAGKFFYCLGNKIHAPEKTVCEQNKVRWYKIDGDKNLRLEYPLNPNSIVVDIGGYEGDWTAEISARYDCVIYILEPVKSFYTNIQNRFKNNSKIKIFPFGLGANDEELDIAVMSESSSVFRDKNQRHQDTLKQRIVLKGINSFIRDNNISTIDLMKINIEGGEYDLLESLIASGFIRNIQNVQVQFHDFVENAETRMNDLKNKLSETHELTYEYVFVWENWRRRKN